MTIISEESSVETELTQEQYIKALEKAALELIYGKPSEDPEKNRQQFEKYGITLCLGKTLMDAYDKLRVRNHSGIIGDANNELKAVAHQLEDIFVPIRTGRIK